jgi:predicted permease
LPFPEPNRLVLIFNSYPQAGVDRDGSSVTNYFERRGQIPAFSELALFRPSPAIVGEASAARREQIMQVSPEFFTVLNRGPAIGRVFTEEDTTTKASPVVILSDGYWRENFNSDTQIIGKQIHVNGGRRTVVGVLPAGFHFLSFKTRLYFPFGFRPESSGPSQRHSGGNVTQMIARLRPSADIRAAQAQIDAHNAAMEADDSQAGKMAAAGFRSRVVPLQADHVAAIRPTLWLMQAGGLLLLVIGAVNLGNLLLVRASVRARELAVRQALGASSWHVVGEIVSEALLLTVAGGLLGLVVGSAGIELLLWLGADKLPLGAHLAFNARLAVATLGGAVVLGLGIGLSLAWFSLRGQPLNAFQSSGRMSTFSRAAQRVRQGFIVAQLALAFVLLAGAAQLVLSFKRSMAVFPGFNAGHVMSGKIWIPPASASSLPALVNTTERIVAEVGRRPGVEAAGLITNIPFSGATGKSAATVRDRVAPVGESPKGHYAYSVTGNYFEAMDFALRAGRFLTADDSRRAERVCVVDEEFARSYWPHGSALGHQIFEGSQQRSEKEAYTIVGVVGTVKQAGLDNAEAPGAVYYPLGHRPDRDVYIVARASLDPVALTAALLSAVREADPKLPLSELRTMESRIADSLAGRRSPAVLGGIFAGVALLLAAIGIYGVLSYTVTQQHREIGIRLALGAQPRQISRQFLGLGLRLLATGLVIGIVGTGLVGRAIHGLLYDVPALYWPSIASTGAILGVVALIACLIPTRRAAKVDPVITLRAE